MKRKHLMFFRLQWIILVVASLSSCGGGNGGSKDESSSVTAAENGSSKHILAAPAVDAAPVSGAVLFGSSVTQQGLDSDTPGSAEAFVYVANASGVTDSAHVYIDSSSTATRVIVGFYADGGGTPASLLGSATIDAPVAGSWNSARLPAIQVTQGQRYWIALLAPVGEGVLRFRDVASGGGTAINSLAEDLSALPARWSSGPRWANSPASAYVSALPVASSGTTDPTTPTPPASAPASTPASAPTSTPAPTLVLGSASVQAFVDRNSDGEAEAFVYTAQASRATTEVKVYVDALSAAASLVVGVYNDKGSGPGALLARGSLDQPKSGAWNSVAIPSISLTAGTRYWVALMSPVGKGALAIRDVSSGGTTSITSAQKNLSDLPSAWINGTSWASSPASVYLVTSDSAPPDPPVPPVTTEPDPTPTADAFFFDDFNGTSLGSAWSIVQRRGPASQDENECNTADAVSVSNGALGITTSATPATCGDAVTAAARLPYTSGDIQWAKINFTYGTVEVRAKFPAQSTGTWPAIWLLGANCQAANLVNGSENTAFGGCPSQGSPDYRELDMVECDGRGWCHIVVAQGSAGWSSICSFHVDADWHVFTLTWNASTISMAVDAKATGCSFPNTALHDPMFLIVQTQTTTSNGVSGTPNNASLPTTLQVDYVKVTQP